MALVKLAKQVMKCTYFDFSGAFAESPYFWADICLVFRTAFPQTTKAG